MGLSATSCSSTPDSSNNGGSPPDSPDALLRYLLMPVSGLYTLAGTGMQTRAISETWVPTDPGTLEAVRGAARVWVLAPNGHPDAARSVGDALAREGIQLGLQDVRKLAGPTLSVLRASVAAAPAVPGAHDQRARRERPPRGVARMQKAPGLDGDRGPFTRRASED